MLGPDSLAWWLMLGRVGEVGKTTNDAVTARETARKRLLALNADRAARDARIEAAAAKVITTAGKLTDATAAADAARAEARTGYEAALNRIAATYAAAVSKAEPAVAAGLVELTAEKLSPADVAALTDLPVAEVKRLLKSAPAASSAPAATVAAPVPADTAVLPVAVDSVPADAAALAG